LLEAYVNRIIAEPNIIGKNKQSFTRSLAHIVKKVYEMELEDRAKEVVETTTMGV
jgi:hypothetical protein